LRGRRLVDDGANHDGDAAGLEPLESFFAGRAACVRENQGFRHGGENRTICQVAVAVVAREKRAMEKRLMELEIRYTHQESLLQELSAVLFEQQQTIAGLETRVRELEARITESGEEGAEPIPNDPPPHY
jgi:SlyX protein